MEWVEKVLGVGEIEWVVVVGRVHQWTWVWREVGLGGHGGLERSLGWVAYLGQTASLVEDLDWVAGGRGWSGCLSGGRRRFAGPLGSICTSDVCVYASSAGWARLLPSLGWSWWSLSGA